jgi:hypothetical protein
MRVGQGSKEKSHQLTSIIILPDVVDSAPVRTYPQVAVCVQRSTAHISNRIVGLGAQDPKKLVSPRRPLGPPHHITPREAGAFPPKTAVRRRAQNHGAVPLQPRGAALLEQVQESVQVADQTQAAQNQPVVFFLRVGRVVAVQRFDAVLSARPGGAARVALAGQTPRCELVQRPASGVADEGVRRGDVGVDFVHELESCPGALRGGAAVVLLVVADVTLPVLDDLVLADGLSRDFLLLVGGPIKLVSAMLAGFGRGDTYMVSVW